MSKEIEITCVACGKKVKTTGTGDFSTFVCEECQEIRNLPAYKAEIVELEKLGEKEGENPRTESQDRRLAFVKDKIVKIEEAIKADEEAKGKE
jgi:endogenous inhibitor of DNA gyrase (YacG/DUF329 family)